MYSLFDSQFWITLFVTLIKSKLLTYHKEKDYFDPQLYIQSSIANFHVEIRSSMHLKMCSQNSFTLCIFNSGHSHSYQVLRQLTLCFFRHKSSPHADVLCALSLAWSGAVVGFFYKCNPIVFCLLLQDYKRICIIDLLTSMLSLHSNISFDIC